MKISRVITNFVRYLIDEFTPPVIRDSKLFMWLPFKILFRDKSHYFFEFKEKAPFYTDKEIEEIYRQTKSVHLSRDTDLNHKCLEQILEDVEGRSVLDAGCGSGFLCQKLEEGYDVTAVDFVKDDRFDQYVKRTDFYTANLSKLPFDDDQFDTVICSHTLEHIREIKQAFDELKRVSRKKLIIVVPKQRPYKYTFDLHVHFFPNCYDFLLSIGEWHNLQTTNISVLDGDIYYVKEIGNDSKQ